MMLWRVGHGHGVVVRGWGTFVPLFDPGRKLVMITSIFVLVLVFSSVIFLLRCRGSARRANTAVSYRRVRQKEGEEGRVNVLVTGAEGALASHVVERLIKDGGYNVHCLDLHIPKEEQRNHNVCSYIQTDITKYGDVESAGDASSVSCC